MADGLEVRDLLPGAPEIVEVGGEELAVLATAQVVVAGGGPAGAIAAIAAGRQGADVIVVEPQPFLGGVGTGGAIHWYYWGLSGGLQDELDRRDGDLDGRISASTRGFHPEARKIELARMAGEAGVALWLRTCAVGAVVEDRVVRGVVVDGERGRGVILCDVVIDATGDADVAALAGAEFTMGREGDGLLMAYSLTPGVARGEWHVWHHNFDAGFVDPTDPWDYSRGFLDGRRFLWREEYAEDERMHFCSPVLGLRESRQIIGDYVLTLDDLFLGQCFRDTIGKTRSHYDQHARDYALESHQATVLTDVTANRKTALQCDLPYRCLLPRGLDGLLVAGRCISMTHDAEASVRMQKDMHRIGEAAGIAAALAARDGVAPREIDVGALQRELIKSGILTQAEVRAGEAHRRRELRPVEELVEMLSSDRPDQAMYELYLHGPGAFEALRGAMASGEGEAARWAALVLGAHRREEARPLLAEMLIERDETMPCDASLVQPRWVSALACLSRYPSRDLLEALVDVLDEDRSLGEHWLYALSALATLADERGADAVRRFLAAHEDDERFAPETWGPRRHAGWGWKFRLAAARALRAMGDAEGEAIIRSFVDDPRLPVRRYAARLLGRRV